MTRTALYRFYDAGQRLLYLGVTSDLERRTSHHKSKADWFREVSDTKVEWLDAREHALALEAVEYLLGVIDQFGEIVTMEHHPVDGWACHLCPQERRLAIALHDANGAMAHDALASAMYFADPKGDTDQIAVLKVRLVSLRKKLPAGVSIRTIWGFGYQMEFAEPLPSTTAEGGSA